ncbi:MAG: hypothetical protein IJD48_02780 [Clostridia bacterium]|nr:hypothetical protein [Clostridia bacterium]
MKIVSVNSDKEQKIKLKKNNGYKSTRVKSLEKDEVHFSGRRKEKKSVKKAIIALGIVASTLFALKKGLPKIKNIIQKKAKDADLILTGNIDKPFDFILTDLQMETDFLPLNAGEWLIKQAQFYPEYKKTKIIIISASPVIDKIAQKYNVDFIPKRCCQTLTEYEKHLLLKQNS